MRLEDKLENPYWAMVVGDPDSDGDMAVYVPGKFGDEVTNPPWILSQRGRLAWADTHTVKQCVEVLGWVEILEVEQ